MEQANKVIGRRIKILRIEKGYSQTALAGELGVSQTNMSNIECGRIAVTVQNLLKLHDILDCSMADFFIDIDKPRN